MMPVFSISLSRAACNAAVDDRALTIRHMRLRNRIVACWNIQHIPNDFLRYGMFCRIKYPDSSRDDVGYAFVRCRVSLERETRADKIWSPRILRREGTASENNGGRG